MFVLVGPVIWNGEAEGASLAGRWSYLGGIGSSRAQIFISSKHLLIQSSVRSWDVGRAEVDHIVRSQWLWMNRFRWRSHGREAGVKLWVRDANAFQATLERLGWSVKRGRWKAFQWAND